MIRVRAFKTAGRRERRDQMKRVVGITAGLCLVAILSFTGLAFAKSATAATAPPARVNHTHLLPDGFHNASHPETTSGPIPGVWTLYDMENGAQDFCTVLTFASKASGTRGTFSDDQGGSGKWSGEIKLTWEKGGEFGSQTSFEGRWDDGDGYFVGSTVYHDWNGPLILVRGTDPYGWGDC